MKYPTIGIKYGHYKGGVYEVLTLATHSETQEPMVVYKSMSFGNVYVRPLSMWFEEVENKPGKKCERFKRLGDNYQ